MVVAVKVPSGLAVVYTAIMYPKSLVGANASEYRMMLAQSEPALSGPTDPDTVTVCPATTGLGLTWTTTGVVVDAAHAGAASGVSMATVTANRRAAMMRTGRIATSPDKCATLVGAAHSAWLGPVTAERPASVAAGANRTRAGRDRGSEQALLPAGAVSRRPPAEPPLAGCRVAVRRCTGGRARHGGGAAGYDRGPHRGSRADPQPARLATGGRGARGGQRRRARGVARQQLKWLARTYRLDPRGSVGRPDGTIRVAVLVECSPGHGGVAGGAWQAVAAADDAYRLHEMLVQVVDVLDHPPLQRPDR